METSRFIRRGVCAGMLMAALVLGACSDDSTPPAGSGGITVLSAQGSVALSGTWVGCSPAGPSNYEGETYSFDGATLLIVGSSQYTLSDCSDTQTTTSVTVPLTADGQKEVRFSTDGTTEVTAPNGLTAPLMVTRVRGTVTASTHGSISVGDVIRLLLYVDDRSTPLVLYRDNSNGAAGADGYPQFLHTADTLTRQP